jgi:hypothetical protein
MIQDAVDKEMSFNLRKETNRWAFVLPFLHAFAPCTGHSP